MAALHHKQTCILPASLRHWPTTVLTATPNHIVYIAPAAAAAAAGNTTAAAFAERLPVAARDIQVGDGMFVQLSDVTAVTTSPVVDISPVVLPTAYAVHTLRGNTIVDGIAVSNFGDYLQLDARDSEATRHAAAAKLRLLWHAAPRLMGRLHECGLLYPLTEAIKSACTKADALASSNWRAVRALGSAASCAFNAAPAALEAALVKDSQFPGEVL